MVDVLLNDDHVVIHVRGLHKLWAMTSQLTIPLAHIRGVYADPTVDLASRGLHFPGTYVPGVIRAGTFYQGGQRIFWDVRDPTKAIVFELSHSTYDFLIVEVQDPHATVRQIWAALTKHTT